MPLNPTGSEIPRSLTQIGTTIDVALDGKADFVRVTDNPSTATAASSYAITGTLEFDGTPITGPASLDFVSTNLWQGDSSSLSIESGKWRLIFGGPSVQGSWLSAQTTATRPENCTWIEEEDVSGTPILAFTRATVATTGQFALADDGVYDPVMWQNIGDDVTPDWVPLTTATALSAHTSATGNVHSLSAANVRSILGVSTLSGSNTGDQNLAPYATTSAVAAGYQPLDADLTAIAALTTTSDGRALLTESVAATGTGALVRAASPTLTGTLNAAAITASGTLDVTGAVTLRGGANSHNGYSFYGLSGDIYSANDIIANANYRIGAAALFTNAFPTLQVNGGGAFTTTAVTGNLTASGTVRVGGGTVVANILSATATLDFPSIGSNDTETLTITVTGAVAGDSVFLGCPAGLDAGLVFCASVTAADTVTVRMHNSSGGSVNPASGTFRATVIRF